MSMVVVLFAVAVLRSRRLTEAQPAELALSRVWSRRARGMQDVEALSCRDGYKPISLGFHRKGGTYSSGSDFSERSSKSRLALGLCRRLAPYSLHDA
jgi:hypothetical protein